MIRELPSIAGSTYAAAPLNWSGGAEWMPSKTITEPPRTLNVNFPQPEKESNTMARRLVQVLIADPNENVPTADCLLYKGEPVLTDATDQELYFDIDIKSILAAHNEKRVNLIDKKIKDRTEHLEPAKVRDLKMVVVTIATF